MAQTGTVVFSTGVITGHWNIYSDPKVSNYPVHISSGAFPITKYKINSVVMRYTIRNSLPSATMNVYSIRGSTTTQIGAGLYLGASTTMTGPLSTNYDYTTLRQIGLQNPKSPYIPQIQGGSDITITVTWELDQVPSDFTMSTSQVVAGQSFSISFTPYRENYKHKWTLLFGTAQTSGSIRAGITSATIQVPLNFLNQIPAALSGKGTLKLQTQEDQNGVTKTFTQYYEKQITINAPDGIGPNIQNSCSVSIRLLTQGINDYVQTKTGFTAKILNPITQYGATISNYSIASPEYTVNGNILESGPLNRAGTQTIAFYVTDSRGLTDTKYIQIEVIPYERPVVLSTNTRRVSQTGQNDPVGNYGKWVATWKYSTVNNKNTLQVNAYIIINGEERPILVSSSGNQIDIKNTQGSKLQLHYMQKYQLKLELIDKYHTVIRNFQVPSGNFAIHFREDGTAVCFGGASTQENAVQIAQTRDVVFKGQRLKSLFGRRGQEVVDANSELNLGIVTTSDLTQNIPIRQAGSIINIGSVIDENNPSENLLTQFFIPDNSNSVNIWARKKDEFSWSSWVALTDKYPVGSIYMSVNDTSPALLFGGTWERIESKFLLGASADYVAGSSGGQAEHVLTVQELAEHTHTMNWEIPTAGWQMETGYDVYAPNMNQTYKAASRVSTKTGGNAPHNNMPPYLAVYIWKRMPDTVGG